MAMVQPAGFLMMAPPEIQNTVVGLAPKMGTTGRWLPNWQLWHTPLWADFPGGHHEDAAAALLQGLSALCAVRDVQTRAPPCAQLLQFLKVVSGTLTYVWQQSVPRKHLQVPDWHRRAIPS